MINGHSHQVHLKRVTSRIAEKERSFLQFIREESFMHCILVSFLISPRFFFILSPLLDKVCELYTMMKKEGKIWMLILKKRERDWAIKQVLIFSRLWVKLSTQSQDDDESSFIVFHSCYCFLVIQSWSPYLSFLPCFLRLFNHLSWNKYINWLHCPAHPESRF